MRVKCTVDINTSRILASRGLGGTNKARKYLADEIVRLSDKYVPKSSGSGAHFKNRVTVASDGSEVVYPGPYAHYQWEGVVRAGPPPRQPTGEKLNYHDDTGLRGQRWTERMMIDKGHEIEKNVENFIKKG